MWKKSARSRRSRGFHATRGFSATAKNKNSDCRRWTLVEGPCRGPGPARQGDKNHDQRGFSVIELAVVTAIFLIVAAIAIPTTMTALQTYRTSSSARSIASQLALAKMTAASNFTQAELNCNLAGNSCQLEVCTTKGVSSCTTFTNQGGAVLLSPGVSFGYGSITTPAGTQTTIQNTAQIVFNSRGIPVIAGAATSNDALYVTDQAGDTYAVTVYASGRVAVWRYGGGVWSLQ